MVELVCLAPVTCERRSNLVLGVGVGSFWRPDAVGAAMLEQVLASSSDGDRDADDAVATSSRPPAPLPPPADVGGGGGASSSDSPMNALLLDAATASEVHECARLALTATHVEVLRHALGSLKQFFAANGSGLKLGFMDTSTQLRALKQLLGLYAQSSDSLFRAFTFSQSLLGTPLLSSPLLSAIHSLARTESSIAVHSYRQPGDRLDGKGVARDRVQTHVGARPEPQREGYGYQHEAHASVHSGSLCSLQFMPAITTYCSDCSHTGGV